MEGPLLGIQQLVLTPLMAKGLRRLIVVLLLIQIGCRKS